MVNSRMERQFRNIIVFSGVSLVVTSFIFVSYLGIIGAATALFISELLLVLLMVYYVEYKNKFDSGLLLKKVQHN
ncbi:hypothetical protein [Paenibacillus sp. EPM92]|nr:hypothetical protein [Paenibacillus sp. EPM92]